MPRDQKLKPVGTYKEQLVESGKTRHSHEGNASNLLHSDGQNVSRYTQKEGVVNAAMFSVAGPWGTHSHISPKSPMIKSKPTTLPSNWFHSQSDSHSSIYSGSSGIIISNVLH